ncbi:MAG: hydantoinase/oxoprolinase family protein [Anaerolineae bacterium]|nr:hydantoinase/oxoprolinase family protein [Anaerolineae bacterium]
MKITLGIDTGGTYTDAVLVAQEMGAPFSNNAVLASAKALTTYHNLALGIEEAVARVLTTSSVMPAAVELVGLSTTLATNAVVQDQGCEVCLLLIGYDPELIKRHGFTRDLATPHVVYVHGGHDVEGNELAPLDEETARAAILAYRDRVQAFAVSGYFGVRNPDHELRVRAFIEELTAVGQDGLPLPVTCGHELTTRLDSVRRATTTVLNARLIPLLRELMVTVQDSLRRLGIAAPLMVVKGDGSLVRAEWAIHRPIETILSGPAASVVGAFTLTHSFTPGGSPTASLDSDRSPTVPVSDVWVADVGGTTTDIAALRNGHPRLNPEGAQVGGWRTMVEAVDVYTVGLGGDSHVRLGNVVWPGEGALAIGPNRVLPLCRLASEFSTVENELRRQLALTPRRYNDVLGQFALLKKQNSSTLSERERELVKLLTDGPRSLVTLSEFLGRGAFVSDYVDALVAHQAVLRAAFTPTDALHVLGRLSLWNVEAAWLGAELLATQVGLSAEAFCERVVAEMSTQVTTAIVTKVLGDSDVRLREDMPVVWAREPAAAGLLARALGRVPASDIACELMLRQPIVAVGAPVEAYLPHVAQQLHTEVIIPEYAEVANALGAVAGGVIQRLQILIRPVDFETAYRLYSSNGYHLPENARDFETAEAAIAYAQRTVPDYLQAVARRAGAMQVEIQMTRVDHTTPVQGRPAQSVFLETELVFTAVGRPALGNVKEQGSIRAEV